VEGSAGLIIWSPVLPYFTDGVACFEMNSTCQFFRF